MADANTTALVRQMREALSAHQGHPEPGTLDEHWRAITTSEAIASADQWLAQQRRPLTDELENDHQWLTQEEAIHTAYMYLGARDELASMERRDAFHEAFCHDKLEWGAA